MDRQALADELKVIVETYLRENNLELVDLVYRYEGRELILRIVADRLEGGITMDECARVNKDIGAILDEKDIIPSNYLLEVSSPGLERPLKSKNDFNRVLKRKVKFFLNDFINGKLEWDAVVVRSEEKAVYADIEGSIVEIPYAMIAKAKQLI